MKGCLVYQQADIGLERNCHTTAQQRIIDHQLEESLHAKNGVHQNLNSAMIIPTRRLGSCSERHAHCARRRVTYRQSMATWKVCAKDLHDA